MAFEFPFQLFDYRIPVGNRRRGVLARLHAGDSAPLAAIVVIDVVHGELGTDDDGVNVVWYRFPGPAVHDHALFTVSAGAADSS